MLFRAKTQLLALFSRRSSKRRCFLSSLETLEPRCLLSVGTPTVNSGTGGVTITATSGEDLVIDDNGTNLTYAVNGSPNTLTTILASAIKTLVINCSNSSSTSSASNENSVVLNLDGSVFSMLTSAKVTAGGGKDTIDAQGSDVVVCVDGGSGNDRIYGSNNAGRDTLFGNSGNDTVLGLAGDDLIGSANQAGTGSDKEAGADILLGGAGEDTIFGGAGNDYLGGEGEDDYLLGGNDNDTISGGEGSDTTTGQAGNDLLLGDAGDDYNYGGAGNDTVIGGAGEDVVKGQNGVDVVVIDTDDQDRETARVILHAMDSTQGLGTTFDVRDVNEFTFSFTISPFVIFYEESDFLAVP